VRGGARERGCAEARAAGSRVRRRGRRRFILGDPGLGRGKVVCPLLAECVCNKTCKSLNFEYMMLHLYCH
jgi:hypothetical protein